ncbi:MAG: alpha/beta hydrolase [Chloroflexi bacterium]|nr:alpha/beta hydrolase [Chloroflexota bacterium]
MAFMHGITSSPVQFRELGQRIFERGYNVFIARMPRHGYADRLSPDHARVTAAEYTAYATETVDLARGLGEHLTLAGLSVSGVLTAWCAQTRADVDLAVPIAPAFAPYGLPFPLVPSLIRLAKALPNVFVWWDPRVRARLGPPCSYPRFATHGLVGSFEVGLRVYAAAESRPPAAGRILAITNPRDMAVNNAATRAVVARWRTHATARVSEYAFGSDLGPQHDIIAPYQPKQRVDYVYPILLDLIDQSA